MSVQDQIYIIWLPLGITLLFGIIGALRGALRTAIVGASVVLAAEIIFQWAGQWGAGLYSIFTGIEQRQQQFILSFALLWMVVLVAGFALGSLLPKERITGTSRLVGALLGLATGAAVAGWSLRYSITNTDGTLSPGPVIDNTVSWGLMVWAGWFPLVLALLAALLVIVGPVRRARSAVGQPSEETNWQPTQAVRQSAVTSSSTAPTMSYPYMTAPANLGAGAGASYLAPSVPPSQVADRPSAPTSEYVVAPRPTVPPPAPLASQETTVIPVQEDAPTTLLPTREVQRGPLGEQDVAAEDTTPAFTRNLASTAPTDGPPAGVSETPFGSSAEPSWLLQTAEPIRDKEPPSPVVSAAPSTMGLYDQPDASAHEAAVSSGEQNSANSGVVSSVDTDKTCKNCGAPLLGGANFCTECGTRVA